ncbi:hypothetical protein NA56DRAFT_318614 [Hyaloscypha hepaticicola]|uniref:N-acetyltransferase domain-containing protein n=1 Tax=Hyaloscypha hepaticicola TaxID=2082293 RepID=A0A2J6PQC5_9HELO|nr:hypothetical protein NA56DRAFT_318614 [Hyaloscypha hepaticicola]
MERISQPVSRIPQNPQVTSSNSPEYRHRLAEISSRACFSDPLNMLFQREKTGSLAQVTLRSLYESSLLRIETKVRLDSTIVEADNFAAVACWEPPRTDHLNHSVEELEELEKERPIYADFIRNIEAAKEACLGGTQEHWQFSLMARDPLRASKGAVRAIIELFVVRSREERVPIWCVAGNERARDVYAYFGFQVVKVVYSGEDLVRTWCMVYNWPIE